MLVPLSNCTRRTSAGARASRSLAWARYQRRRERASKRGCCSSSGSPESPHGSRTRNHRPVGASPSVRPAPARPARGVGLPGSSRPSGAWRLACRPGVTIGRVQGVVEGLVGVAGIDHVDFDRRSRGGPSIGCASSMRGLGRHPVRSPPRAVRRTAGRTLNVDPGTGPRSGVGGSLGRLTCCQLPAGARLDRAATARIGHICMAFLVAEREPLHWVVDMIATLGTGPSRHTERKTSTIDFR